MSQKFHTALARRDARVFGIPVGAKERWHAWSQPMPRRPNVQLVKQAVCDVWGHTLAEVEGPSIRQPVTLHRQIGMYVCREDLGLSYSHIGRQFGGRDHTTVIHAWRSIAEQMLWLDCPLRHDVALLRKALFSKPRGKIPESFSPQQGSEL